MALFSLYQQPQDTIPPKKRRMWYSYPEIMAARDQAMLRPFPDTMHNRDQEMFFPDTFNNQFKFPEPNIIPGQPYIQLLGSDNDTIPEGNLGLAKGAQKASQIGSNIVSGVVGGINKGAGFITNVLTNPREVFVPSPDTNMIIQQPGGNVTTKGTGTPWDPFLPAGNINLNPQNPTFNGNILGIAGSAAVPQIVPTQPTPSTPSPGGSNAGVTTQPAAQSAVPPYVASAAKLKPLLPNVAPNLQFPANPKITFGNQQMANKNTTPDYLKEYLTQVDKARKSGNLVDLATMLINAGVVARELMRKPGEKLAPIHYASEFNVSPAQSTKKAAKQSVAESLRGAMQSVSEQGRQDLVSGIASRAAAQDIAIEAQAAGTEAEYQTKNIASNVNAINQSRYSKYQTDMYNIQKQLQENLQSGQTVQQAIQNITNTAGGMVNRKTQAEYAKWLAQFLTDERSANRDLSFLNSMFNFQ